MKAKNLKSIARTDEDLRIISAHLQDSIVNTANIASLKKNKIFLMQLNRFMWEDVEKGVFRENKRIRCAVKFEEVIKVESKNINQKNKNKPLECLAIECMLVDNKAYKIKIFFSGDSVITIFAEVIDVIMHDLGKPWNVKHVPKHKI